MKRRSPGTRPHPLESVARQAFEKNPYQDKATLGPFMAGATSVTRGGSNAYMKVAEDVLGYMESQGKLRRDPRGWYLLADGSPDGAPGPGDWRG